MSARLRTVTEPSREIDVIHETDVLVVGSGPGGLAAALAAARSGVQVALVERFGCFGGNITTVGVEGFAWYRREQTVEAGGIGWEFEERAKSMGAAVPESQSLSYELDSEGFKLVADRLVEEAGVHPMLHRQFVAPLMDGDTIIGVVTESKAGREAILAQRVIDATGDADVATRAGAPVHATPAEDMMAASVMFHLAGVDKAAFLKGVAEDPQTYRDWAAGEFAAETDEKDADLYSPYLGKPFEKAIADGVLSADLNTIGGTWGAMHDTGELTYMNLVHLAGCDGTDPDSLTRYEIEGRRQAMLAIEALRRYTPGCETARLRNFGLTIAGPVRGQHRHLSRVHRRVRGAGAADDGALSADPVPVAASEGGSPSDRRGSCHRRRPHLPRGHQEHVVLRRHRSGGGRRGRPVRARWPRVGRRGHLRGPGRADPAGRQDRLGPVGQ
jgi:hypothetical protein